MKFVVECALYEWSWSSRWLCVVAQQQHQGGLVDARAVAGWAGGSCSSDL